MNDLESESRCGVLASGMDKQTEQPSADDVQLQSFLPSIVAVCAEQVCSGDGVLSLTTHSPAEVTSLPIHFQS